MNWKKILLSLTLLLVSLYGLAQGDFKAPSGEADTNLVNTMLRQSKEKFTTDPRQAIILATLTKDLAERINFPRGAAYAFKNIGIGYYMQGRYLQSLENYERALSIFDSLGDKRGSANILSNIGAIYFDKGDNTLALNYNLRSLKLSEEIGDKLRIATAMNNVGGVHFNISNTSDKALEYFRQALLIAREIKDNANIGTASVNVGEVYMAKDFDDSALVYFNESLEAYKGTENISYTLNNIGKLYLKKKKISSALKFYKQAFESAKQLSNKLDMAKSLISLGETYQRTGNEKFALEYYRKAESLAVEIGSKNDLMTVYEYLAKTYAGMGDYNNAFKFQTLFTGIKDTLYNLESDKKLSSLQFDFDIQKKQGEINFLTQEKILREAKIKRGKILRTGLLMGLTLVFIMAFVQWRHNQQRQKANLLLQLQKKETEEQKEKAERALEDLKATQSQLIHSEKMASLGVLTAGIAHEIQNPLNFVNNFSELNRDLLAEIKDKIEAGNIEEVKVIADDIAENEQKINFHGKRADAIVKGMLQHTRKRSGIKESTNINALADEYARLAYHGLRVKDKSFNVTMKTVYDEGIGSISIIPEDIGRVILNLITNAFYAVTEKKKQNIPGYEPTVTVSTQKINDRVEVKFKDNGNGISQKIMDKIFQPFFTTKPTGQGTGLGLSLSYDIVKAHGGELKVETKDGECAEFIIQLPVV